MESGEAMDWKLKPSPTEVQIGLMWWMITKENLGLLPTLVASQLLFILMDGSRYCILLKVDEQEPKH